MKNIYKLFILLFVLFLANGCDSSWLDRFPATGTPTDAAITNFEDALTARVGMYDGLQGTSSLTEYYAARIIYYGDVRGDDMQAAKAGNRSSACYEMRYNADDAPRIWNVPYGVIRRANNIIYAIDNNSITDGTPEKIGQIYAEAKTVRALAHFDLVKVHGNPYTMNNGASLGIPIMLKPEDGNYLPGRNTVAEVYNQVIADLTEAINSGHLLSTKTQGYINVWAAKALLSRVYLFKGDNDKALEVAEDVINNSPYKLWTNAEYAKAWEKNNSAHENEMIFEIVNSGTDDWTDREGLAYLYHENGYADAIVTTAFMNLLDPDDVRQDIVMPAMYVTTLMSQYGDKKVFVNKYPAEESNPKEMRVNNIPVLRISEIYLNAAEAAVKSSKNEIAASYLNAIAVRANPGMIPFTSANVNLEKVIIERRKEFIGEGHRFFDAMRNNETIVRYLDDGDIGLHYPLISESRKFDRTYFRAILPIPASETDANPIIKAQQNPGY